MLTQQTAALNKQKLNDEIDDLEQKLINQNADDAISDPDPHGSLISRLTGASHGFINDALTILIALLLEITSAFGFFIAIDYHRSVKATAPAALTIMPAKPPATARIAVSNSPALLESPANIDHLKTFLATAITPSTGAKLEAQKVYNHYLQWCKTTNNQPVSLKVFGSYTRDHTNLEKRKIGGRVRYVGISLV